MVAAVEAMILAMTAGALLITLGLPCPAIIASLLGSNDLSWLPLEIVWAKWGRAISYGVLSAKRDYLTVVWPN